jgi:hypothetical protein
MTGRYLFSLMVMGFSYQYNNRNQYHNALSRNENGFINYFSGYILKYMVKIK